MPPDAGQEDELLQYCYEADINMSTTFDEMLRQIKWDFETKSEKKSNVSYPIYKEDSNLIPNGVKPFWGCSELWNEMVPVSSSSSVAVERRFKTPPRPIYTRYFGNPPRMHKVIPASSLKKSQKNGTNDDWLSAMVDQALLEIGDLAEEEKHSLRSKLNSIEDGFLFSGLGWD